MIGCEPSASVEVVKLAWPSESNVAVPMTWVPSRKEMVPEGMSWGFPGRLTTAVKTTGEPRAAGLALEVRVMALGRGGMLGRMTCGRVPVAAGPKSMLPGYWAEMGCVPTARLAVVKAAMPAASRVAEPIRLPLSRKLTEAGGNGEVSGKGGGKGDGGSGDGGVEG